VVVRSKDCTIKKWRENEFVVMHTASSCYFALLFEKVISEIQKCACLSSIFYMRVYETWCVTLRKDCRQNAGIVLFGALDFASESNRKVNETA
jgi:hypothetical protein